MVLSFEKDTHSLTHTNPTLSYTFTHTSTHTFTQAHTHTHTPTHTHIPAMFLTNTFNLPQTLAHIVSSSFPSTYVVWVMWL